MTYRDDLAAAVARAESAEQRLAETEAELERLRTQRTDVGRQELGDRIFVGISGSVVALSPRDGAVGWSTSVGRGTVHVVADARTVYAAIGGKVHRLDPRSGAVLWTNGLRGLGFRLPSITFAPSGLAPHGVVFVGLASTVVALETSSGEERWRNRLALTHVTTGFTNVALLGNELYATAKGELWCLNPASGEIVWHAPLKGYGLGLASVAPATLANFGLSEDQVRTEQAQAASS